MNAMLSEALQDFTGLLKQLITNLLGNDAETWGSELKKFLRKEPCWVVPLRYFPTWKTITIGTQKSVKDLTKALTGNGFRISDWAGDILKKITLADAETEIELVLASVAELGFTRATRRDAIYDRAKELGLDLVPAEAGPQLRLAYTDQPLNEWMVMAMEPITGSVGGLLVFNVAHNDDGRWLYSHSGYPDSMWYPGRRWVFARRKQN